MSRKLSIEEVKERINRAHGGRVRLVEYPGNMRKKATFKCTECNHLWQTRTSKVVNQGTGCPRCAGKVPYTMETAQEKIDAIHHGRVQLLEYPRAVDKKAIFRCTECNGEWQTTTNQVVYRGTGCPHCAPQSKGEEAIEGYMDRVGLPFMKEYIFDDLKDRGHLRYDFAIFNPQTLELEFLIEFDGIQHFEPIDHWGGEETLEATQRRDKLKDDYAQEAGLELLRIPYGLVDNIGQILTEGKILI